VFVLLIRLFWFFFFFFFNIQSTRRRINEVEQVSARVDRFSEELDALRTKISSLDTVRAAQESHEKKQSRFIFFHSKHNNIFFFFYLFYSILSLFRFCCLFFFTFFSFSGLITEKDEFKLGDTVSNLVSSFDKLQQREDSFEKETHRFEEKAEEQFVLLTGGVHHHHQDDHQHKVIIHEDDHRELESDRVHGEEGEQGKREQALPGNDDDDISAFGAAGGSRGRGEDEKDMVWNDLAVVIVVPPGKADGVEDMKRGFVRSLLDNRALKVKVLSSLHVSCLLPFSCSLIFYFFFL